MARYRDPSLRPERPESPSLAEASTSMRPLAVEEVHLVESVSLTLASLDASHDDTDPDAPVSAIIPHAEALAARARVHWPSLQRAKLAADAPARLEAGVLLLRPADTRWTALYAVLRRSSLADARAAATEGRSDLFQALRLFGEDDPKIQAVLDGLGPEGEDAVLLSDLDRLLGLADTHGELFTGTDLSSARLAEIKVQAAAFRTLRAGASSPEGEVALVARTQEAMVARRMRNRAFWFVAAVEREICKRGRYIFRKSPREAALFTLYTTDQKKPAPKPEPSGSGGGGAPPA